MYIALLRKTHEWLLQDTICELDTLPLTVLYTLDFVKQQGLCTIIFTLLCASLKSSTHNENLFFYKGIESNMCNITRTVSSAHILGQQRNFFIPDRPHLCAAPFELSSFLSPHRETHAQQLAGI